MAWNKQWWHTSCTEILAYCLSVALLHDFVLGFCYTHPCGLCGIGLRDCFCRCFTTSMNTILQLTQSVNWSYTSNFDFKSLLVDPVAIATEITLINIYDSLEPRFPSNAPGRGLGLRLHLCSNTFQGSFYTNRQYEASLIGSQIQWKFFVCYICLPRLAAWNISKK